MCPLQVKRSSCALAASILVASAGYAQVVQDGVQFTPISSSTSIQVQTLNGEPIVVARTTGTSSNPHVRATPAAGQGGFAGFSFGVIPWMLPTAPPDGASLTVAVEGRAGAIDPLRMLAQVNHLKQNNRSRIHFGTALAPAELESVRVELKLTGQPVYAEFRDPCDTFPGVIEQSLCDWIVLGWCYHTLDPDCRCVFFPGECDDYQVGALTSDVAGRRVLSTSASFGRPVVVTTPGRPAFTVDEIVMHYTLACTANCPSLASARIQTTGPAFNGVGIRDITIVPPARECPCDWNNDQSVTSQDFFDYLAGFFSGNGDLTGDGQTTSADFFEFLRCFFNPPAAC